MAVMEQEITDVDGKADSLPRKERSYVAKDWKLQARFHRILPVYAKHGRPEKDLVRLRARDREMVLQKTRRMFAGELSEEAPIPLVGLRAPRWRPVAIDQAIGELVRTTISGGRRPLGEASTQPQIMTA